MVLFSVYYVWLRFGFFVVYIFNEVLIFAVYFLIDFYTVFYRQTFEINFPYFPAIIMVFTVFFFFLSVTPKLLEHFLEIFLF